MTPKYEHDCEKCEYLGTFFDYDVYLCREDRHRGGTIIARYDDEGPDYYSSSVAPLMRQLSDPDYRITPPCGLSMPVQDWLFSRNVCDYYKAWLLALALMPLKQLTHSPEQGRSNDQKGE